MIFFNQLYKYIFFLSPQKKPIIASPKWLLLASQDRQWCAFGSQVAALVVDFLNGERTQQPLAEFFQPFVELFVKQDAWDALQPMTLGRMESRGSCEIIRTDADFT